MIGPIADDEVLLAHAFIRGNMVAMATADARLAASLYNQAGRRRTLKTDALIAAIAIRASASLLTINTDDFRPFLSYGLQLAHE